jgi:hypothetical protein
MIAAVGDVIAVVKQAAYTDKNPHHLISHTQQDANTQD